MLLPSLLIAKCKISIGWYNKFNRESTQVTRPSRRVTSANCLSSSSFFPPRTTSSRSNKSFFLVIMGKSNAPPQWTGKSICKLSLHRRRVNPMNLGYGLEHLPFLFLYAFSLYHCYLTVGEPYAQAIREREEQGLAVPSSTDVTIPGEDGGLAAAMLSQGIVREVSLAAPSINDTVILQEENESAPLPNPFLPGILPLLYLLGTIMAHGLLLLFQVWSVRFKAFIRYTSVSCLDDATFVMVVPRSFKGKSSIVEIVRPKHTDGTSAGRPYFVFQKHKYIAEEEEGDKGNVMFRKLKAPTTETIKFYLESCGLRSEQEIEAQLDIYGKNEFSIPQPNFVDMFKQQLLEPLTVFQIFSVCLYMLDEYWQYSLFTLAMILMFEGVTVMSRLKNLQTLRGMGNTAHEIYVYRKKTWKKLKSDLVVPGDIISIKRETIGDQINMVPCDCLLLDGTAVLNEATLTGESVPQMKEAIGSKMSREDLAEQLDMKSGHKVHVLFGGTTVMQADTSAEGNSGSVSIPHAPDHGCTAYVLRTGFSSSQGKLVRMIEFSSGKVTGSSWDAYGLAFLLLIFALLSSGYVLRHGIEQKGKITFELLLRCVLIITSVIPAELPMQTAMAVNSALLNLVKLSIFCTEPFRISLAGKVDICLFDKTGTLTTDQLTAVGVVCEDTTVPTAATPKNNVLGHVPMIAANLDATLVLAGCQSLVQIDGKMVGDPVEEASIRAIDFTYDASTRYCQAKKDLERAGERRWGQGINQKDVFVQIMHRNHFVSKLQRMSVVAKVHLGNKGVRVRSLVKGSPEAIEKLLRPDSIPVWFWPTYQNLARRGMRVLALAYKDIGGRHSESEVAQQPRSWAESDLLFAGFAVFQCLVRKDSGEIIQVLKDSSHQVSMITGDATLTAVHVSKEVGIITRPALILSESSSRGDPLKWTSAVDDSVIAPYKSGDIGVLVRKYDLCVNGKTLVAAGERDDVIWKNLNNIRVYARMTPELKEQVLTLLKTHGHHTLMCGDGGNDVGALKQAHIGVALLGGFGSANADKSVTGLAKYQKGNVAAVSTRDDLMKLHVSALKKRLEQQNVNSAQCKVKQDYVELILSEQKKKSMEAIKKKQQALAKKNPKLKILTKEEQQAEMKKKQEDLEADVRARQARGESFARMKAIAAFAKREAEEKRKLQMERTGSKGFANFANNAAMAQYMDDFDDGELPMVKLGDASIASPFTSRAPSIKGCVDIIRQGRCALVTTMQMYQILAVNCLISSYSLSVLYLDKVKWANSQMMALGMISTVASITLSRATPLDKLSPVRPLTSIFQPALFMSLAGQFLLHLGCMIYLTNLAKEYTPQGDTTHSKPGDFQPNVMSTVIFLINGVQTVSVCAVNYKGRPFMKPMTENPGLLYSLGISIVGVFLLCTERMPVLNKVLQIVPMPDQRFTRILTGLLTLEVLGAFAWDQFCLLMFAPKIFLASIRALTFKDVRQLLKMTAISLVIIYILANIDYDEIERQQQLLEAQRAHEVSS
ncbi:putative P-type ATPase, subfamily V, P-type ATPase, A domain superfamily, HAD superfamily [Plasmopara halstedii]